tara:strand:- start:1869 stop:2141 length:273 start_codon:yes stop_codon:yes gene_type:complete
MNRELKTELTRDEVLKLLEVYNTIDAMVDDTMEMMDVRLSQLSDVRDKAHALKHMFDFRAPVGADGNPNHWLPCVLPDDDNAWYYNQGEN